MSRAHVRHRQCGPSGVDSLGLLRSTTAKRSDGEGVRASLGGLEGEDEGLQGIHGWNTVPSRHELARG